MKVCKGAKGKPCVVTDKPQPQQNFYKAPRNKDGLYSYCKVCDRYRYKKYYENNKDWIVEKSSNYHKNNPKVNRAAVRKHYKNNREYYLDKAKKWRELKPYKCCEYASRRRAITNKATPPWLSPDLKGKIEEFYWLASDLKRVTGESYHVDHIIPLQGKNVCGLHVPWNLQILPSDLNHSKGNKYNVEDTF